MILRQTTQLGIRRRVRHGSDQALGPDEYRATGLARELGVSRDTIRAGWVHQRLDEEKHRILWADASKRQRLLELYRTCLTC